MLIHRERWDSIPRSLNTKILKTDDFVPFDAGQSKVVISWFTLELLLSSSFLFRYKSKTISDGNSKKINGAKIFLSKETTYFINRILIFLFFFYFFRKIKFYFTFLIFLCIKKWLCRNINNDNRKYNTFINNASHECNNKKFLLYLLYLIHRFYHIIIIYLNFIDWLFWKFFSSLNNNNKL